MKFLKELLKSHGLYSMIRFMSLLSLLIGAGIAIYGLANRSDLSGVAEIVAVFVVSAFGGKVLQKHVERKNETPN